jgi:hypothetical protein
MKTTSMMIIALVAALAALFVPTAAGRRNTSAWNTPASRRRFGIRKTNIRPTPYIVDQALSSSSADDLSEMDRLLQLQEEDSHSAMIEESMHSSSDSRRIVSEGVRAAAVACVSAAAIGGARHALEIFYERQ